MTKVAIDARELRQSTGRYVERLIHYLQQIDTEHDYVILLSPKDMDTWEPTNPRFTKVACPHKEFTFDEQLGFKRQLNKLKPDLVHFAMIQQPVWYKGNRVTTIHDLTTARFRNPSKNYLVFTIKQLVYKWVIKRVARSSTELMVPTQWVKDDVVQYTGVSADKITVTYEAADAIDAAPTPIPELEAKDFIMYIGRPTPHKNLGRLIDAFAILQKQHPDLWLVLAGKKDKNYEMHEAAVKQLGLRNVLFTDFIPDSKLRWLYENCKAYVFPSLSEGFGLPGLEAMSHNAPVVSSNATCLPEIYGDAAKYFDPTNVQDMAAKINEVIEDPILREELCEKGKKQIKKYSWKRMAEQTLDVYKKALGEQ